MLASGMDFDNNNEIVKMTTNKVYILMMGSYSTFHGNKVN